MKIGSLTISGMLGVACFAASLLTIGGFFGNIGLLFDQMAHFRVQYAIGLAIIAALFALLRNWQWAGIAGVLLIINIACIAPLYIAPAAAGATSSQTLKILMINVYTANTRHQDVLDHINTTNADIVALEEINSRWADALKPLEARYPYHLIHPQEDNFGIALYSRIEADSLVRYFGDEATASIVAGISAPGGRATLVFMHPVPPVSPRFFGRRNIQLEYFARVRHHYSDTMVLIGDLNMTSWSYYFRKLIRESGLTDTRRGFGLQASWPTNSWWLRVPIDHALVSPGVRVIDRRIGPDIGSDHFPVYLELQL